MRLRRRLFAYNACHMLILVFYQVAGIFVEHDSGGSGVIDTWKVTGWQRRISARK